MKPRILLILVLILTLGFSVFFADMVKANTETANNNVTITTSNLLDDGETEEDEENSSSDDLAALILLGDEISISGQGAETDGENVYITAGGTYSFSGELKDGQIDINTTEKVKIILDGAYISNSSGPALMVTDAKKVTLILEEGTSNYLGDEQNNSEYDAALFTNDTLVIKGEGTLVINGNNWEGISSDDDIIESGTLRIIAQDDGLNAHDDITIEGGYVYILAGGDGIDSNGTIHISGGMVISLGSTAGGDGGIDSVNVFKITGGTLIATGNTSAAPVSDSSQYSLYFKNDTILPEGTLFYIEDPQGNEILTFAPERSYLSVLHSSAELTADTEYQICLGGSADGTDVDGLYETGVYNASGSSTLTALSAIVPEGAGEMSPGGGMHHPDGTLPAGEMPEGQPPQE